MDAIMPIITNKHSIEVSQSWAGHPGMLLASFDPEAPVPDAAGFVQQKGAIVSTSPNVHVANMTVGQAEDWCAASEECAAFTFR